MNRQQFNRYLNGSSLPSLAVAERIAEALKTSVSDLLADRSDVSVSRMSVEETMEHNQIGFNRKVREGFYLEFMPSDVFQNRTIVSVVRLKWDGLSLRFRRKMPLQIDNRTPSQFWTYDGFVYQSTDAVFVMYINSSLRENHSSYLLNFHTPMTQDLSGIKTSVTSSRTTRLNSMLTFFVYKGVNPDLRALFRKTGMHDNSSFTGTETDIISFLNNGAEIHRDRFLF